MESLAPLILAIVQLVLLAFLRPAACLEVEKKVRAIGGSENPSCASFDTCAECIGYRAAGITSSSYSGFLRHKSDDVVAPWRQSCHWCLDSASCVDARDDDTRCWSHTHNRSTTVTYVDECPLGPTPYPESIEFLPNWMGSFRKAGLLSLVRLIDICLPGTHDSLSYDLSLTVSADGLDNLHRLANFLHEISGGTITILPGQLEDFFRTQAKTQQLTITQQLDNGIRFIDFRLMIEPESKKWYSIHFLQSKLTVQSYFEEIRRWMDQHPDEVVVLWLSKHGNPAAKGQDQYPGVSVEEKQALWRAYTSTFDGLFLDTTQTDIFRDPLETLLQRSHRLVTFATDHAEFTGSSRFALDAARIQNQYDSDDGAFHPVDTVRKHLEYFRNAGENNAQVHARSGFTLLGLNTQGKAWQISAAAENRFLHWRDPLHVCDEHWSLPNERPSWCPDTLLDIAQLASFYNQISLEAALRNQTSFPNALYLDGIDVNGTIRTGPQLLNGERRDCKASRCEAKYGYAYAVLTYNARRVCAQVNGPSKLQCQRLNRFLATQRSNHPMELWDNFKYARDAGLTTVASKPI